MSLFIVTMIIRFLLPKWKLQFSSVVQSCPPLCEPMDPSTLGFPVQHQLPELAQTYVHLVGNAIQPSHPLSSPSPLAPNPSSIRVFSNGSNLRMRWLKYGSFSFNISPSNEHPGLIPFRMDWLDLFARYSQESSTTPQSKSTNSSALSFPKNPTLTSIHDYWKNHSFDLTDVC